jgi:integral membrane protein
MLDSPIGRLRLIGLLEGVSYLLLLGIAMPLKYWAGMPEVVSVVGMAHGVLFCVFCLALLQAFSDCDWTLKRAAGLFCAAVLPFGPFVVDAGLKREQAERAAVAAAESDA